MEIIIITILAIATHFWISYRVWKNSTAQIEHENKEKELTESEEIDQILENYRRSRRRRRQEEIEVWNDQYFKSLPVTQHPDYFKLDPASDDVEGFVQKSADGSICAKFWSRTSATGVPYQAKLDYVTQVVHVTTPKISWSVPFSEVDNYTQYM